MGSAAHEHHRPICFDCPAARRDALMDLVGDSRESCRLVCRAVEAREPLPGSWGRSSWFGLVRRGIVLRQHTDRRGHVTAVDAAGPGCLLPLRSTEAPQGFAVSRLLVCLGAEAPLGRWIEEQPQVGVDLLRLQREAMERVERYAAARTRSAAKSRLAAVLCILQDTLSPSRKLTAIPSDLQQRDLAALLGMRHETVCRVLGQFEREGLVRKGPEGLEIVDRAALEQV